MGRQLRIVHRTGYRYNGWVSASHNEARMTPRSSREQLVLASKVDITPLAWKYTYVDYWGTRVTAFEIGQGHREMDVVATSTVDIGERFSDGLGVSWEEIQLPDFTDQYCEMLQILPSVQPPEDAVTLAKGIAADSATPAQAVKGVVDLIRGRVDYVPGATEVRTPAVEVWSKGAGVCQDMVHLTLGILRSIGVPCRYVSGYVMPSQDAEPGETKVGESHAWLQYWDGVWVGIDPTNAVVPGDTHVEVGVGRDYFDVPPLKGVYSGSRSSDMFVEVEMTVLG
ncbi:MAG: transglutaminase family protein [Propionibacteriaceae bacterium]|jgi:transglutaminase-like putative cysteine protease|nr:transglutaminase family protein [Propionibacteriaceae bacterium]